MVTAGILLLIAVELVIPAWAESASPTPWHPHHIAERHGLLTIIVLGESVLAAAGSIRTAMDGGHGKALVPTIAGGLLILYSMWWLYFEHDGHTLLSTLRRTFVWAYLHYLVFGAAAAVGAGLSVVVVAATDHAVIGVDAALWALAIPAAIYVFCLWFLMDRGHGRPIARAPGPIAAILLLFSPLARGGVLMIGLILASYLVFKLVVNRHDGSTIVPA